ncbi:MULTISPECIES: amidase [unclassified Ruegeria]|uniref:amidase n=1 Tax=unclassified Ruegeria TaxID=2625375 RepID=UPI001ADC4A43|nr:MULTISPECIES: amidase [unclassified Ruegeria]MBO9410435.1 amidase [Ruegeria sp. R8_1]MBO9414346.1 amidase [Ruegeria sp. R8_2]
MNLSQITATALVTELSEGRVSASEVMRATLDRIAAVNGDLNAIVGLRDEGDLMAEAAELDKGANRGPLHGVPIAVKDLVNVAGVVSTQGSPLFRDHIPQKDDMIAARMRAAGAILIGKTNTPEFGLGSHTFNPVYGATRNPYDSSRTCGGSSGGAAVALASGMVTLADGSDMMGSLRNPAAWNNVYGFRPSWGRVPSEPVGDAFLHQLSTLGPMARCPEDLGLLLDVISERDTRQPYSVKPEPVGPVQARDLTGVRIGWLGDWGGAYPFEDGITDLCREAVSVLAGLGAQVDDVVPDFEAERLWESWTVLRSWSIAASLAPLTEHRSMLKDTAQWELDRGLALTAMQVHRASEMRSEWFRHALGMFNTYDALILPSAQVWPFEIETPYPTEIAGTKMDTYHRWMEVVLPVSLIGLPCLSVPAGFGSEGVPMGMQVFGPRGTDAKLLSIGAAYHAATEWPQKRPAS